MHVHVHAIVYLQCTCIQETISYQNIKYSTNAEYSFRHILLSSEILSERLPAILDTYKDVTFKQMKHVKLIFYGAPRAGKTTLRKQLLRHVKDVELQPCGINEPSTDIAEMCDSIFVQRVAMTNEGNNEWKWTVHKLDDIARTLLLCLDNKLLQDELESSDASIKGSTTKSDEQQKSDEKQKEIPESQNLSQVGAVQVSKQKASDVIHHTKRFKRNQYKDINVKDVFQNAIKNGEWADVVSTLNADKAMFLHIIDGGGQPSFQEIFPLLINGPSVTLLVFKLTDDLETLYKAQYQPKSGSGELKTWEDHYVIKDIIFHALSSSAISEKCKIFLVGTHKDKLDGNESEKKAKIDNISRLLHGWLCQSKAFKYIEAKSTEDVIIGIDNSNKQDIVTVKKKIEDLISQLDSKDIPAPWLVFDIVLHKYSEQNELRRVGKRDCTDIAYICGVKEEIDVVLHYLHDQAGTLLYYSDILELNQDVIIDVQLIFESISKIIIQFFDDNSKHGPNIDHKNLFKQKGQLDASVLLKGVEGCLEKDELLSLLQHRHIISRIEETKFFMPCVLTKIELLYSQSSNSSFLVLFENGYCPVGLFCAATTRLIVAHKWTVNTGESQFRNKINFYCKCSGISYNVIFSAFAAHYEVCVMGEASAEFKHEVKYFIYQRINQVFADICKHMKCPSPSYGFYCPGKTCKCGDVSYPQYQHPAKCEFSYESLEMICCYSDTPIRLTEKHKQWFPPPQVSVTNAWIFKPIR